jgi:hypothetical protein
MSNFISSMPGPGFKQLGFVGRAATHGKQRTETELLHFLVIEHLATDFRFAFGKLRGLLCDVGGVANVGRQVGKFAREEDAFGNGACLIQTFLRLVPAGEIDAGKFRLAVLFAWLDGRRVAVGRVIGSQCSRTHTPGRVTAGNVHFGEEGKGALDRQAAQYTCRFHVHFLEACGIETFLRTQAHDQYALGVDAFRGEQDSGGACLAGDVATLNLALDGTVRCAVHACCGAGEQAVFVNAYDHARGVGGFGSSGAKAELERHHQIPAGGR